MTAAAEAAFGHGWSRHEKGEIHQDVYVNYGVTFHILILGDCLGRRFSLTQHIDAFAGKFKSVFLANQSELICP